MRKLCFFGSIFSLLTLLPAFLILLLSGDAYCRQDQYKVINVKNVVRLDADKERSYRDIFTNYGSSNGAKIGGALKVHRRIIKRSEVEMISDKVVNIPIGTLEVISVEQDSSVARLVSLEERADNPLAVYDTAMIGDIVTPIEEKTVKKMEEILLPETVLFDFDKYDLKSEAKKVLRELAKKITTGGYKRIEIATHTDSIGSDEYNKALSEKRAQSIMNYFIRDLGLQGELFTARGYGESKPIASNKTKKDRQKNRRGVLTFYK